MERTRNLRRQANLLSLPLEIRQEIYKLVLFRKADTKRLIVQREEHSEPTPKYLTARKRTSCAHNAMPVCRQIFVEVAGMLYHENQIIFDRGPWDALFFLNFMMNGPENVIDSIRSVWFLIHTLVQDAVVFRAWLLVFELLAKHASGLRSLTISFNHECFRQYSSVEEAVGDAGWRLDFAPSIELDMNKEIALAITKIRGLDDLILERFIVNPAGRRKFRWPAILDKYIDAGLVLRDAGFDGCMSASGYRTGTEERLVFGEYTRQDLRERGKDEVEPDDAWPKMNWPLVNTLSLLFHENGR